MTKATYVDGFVIAIPKKNTAAYKKMAREAAQVWKKFGALDYKECIIDDAKPNEAIWFSYIAFKNKRHRDEVNKKVMAHFEKKYDKDMPMPFDMKRLAYAGFKVEVSA